MKEIEVKILEVDTKEIESKLVSLGAKKIFDGPIVWTAFDFSDGRFSKEEVLVRLRKKGDDSELTVKKLISTKKEKISEETEVSVSDYEKAKKILLALGMKEKQWYPMTKRRISYVLEKVHFEIDTFPQFPTLLEIEAPSSEIVQQYVKKLGYRPEDAKPWGAREVFAYYRSLKK